MERKIAPFYLSLAGGFLLACSPEVNLPTPEPITAPSPTLRSLVRVRDLEIETLQIL